MINIKREFTMTDDAIPIAAIVLQRRFCNNCNLTYATMVRGKCFACGMKVCVHCKSETYRIVIGRCNTCSAYRYRNGYDRPYHLISKPMYCKCNKDLRTDPHKRKGVCNACRKRKKRNV